MRRYILGPDARYYEEERNFSISNSFLKRFKMEYERAGLVDRFGPLNKQKHWANLFKIARSSMGYHLTGKRDRFSKKIYDIIIHYSNKLLGEKITQHLDELYRKEERILNGFKDLNIIGEIQNELESIVGVRKIEVFDVENWKEELKIVDNESLKGYIFLCNKIINEHPTEIEYVQLLRHSKKFILKLFKSVEIITNNLLENQKRSKKDKYTQKELSSYVGLKEGYIIKGENGFETIKGNRNRSLYQFILYRLTCKLIKFHNLPYIGFTADLDNRLGLHVFNSLEPPHILNRTFKKIVPLQKAIRLSIEKEFDIIQEKISYIDSIDSDYTYNAILSLDDIYYWLEYKKGTWAFHMLIEFIINKILRKYFIIDILELHKNVETVRKREKKHTLKHKHSIGYGKDSKIVYGTIYPNGLNSTIGGRGAEMYVDIPLLDIAAMFTLGYTVLEEITDILIQEYGHINELSASTVSRRIKEVFDSRESTLELFLKPIVMELILDEYNFELRDLNKILDFSRQGLTLYLKKWSEGKTFRILRDEKRKKNFTLLELERRYGIQLTQWIYWTLEGKSQERIAKIVGKSRSKIIDIYKKISFILFNKKLSYEQFKKKIRKKIAIRLLKQGVEPKQIIDEVFKMNLSNSIRNFVTIFNNKSFNEILEKYYKKSPEN